MLWILKNTVFCLYDFFLFRLFLRISKISILYFKYVMLQSDTNEKEMLAYPFFFFFDSP
jgi:hypothetical protein